MAKKKAIKKVTKKTAKKVAKKSAKAARSAKKTAPRKAAKKRVAKKESKKPAATPLKKTTTINPYITFNGSCEEAFNFYKSVFGGQFATVQRFKSMPPMEGGKQVPESEGEKLMHISLPISQETILMGSDSSESFGPPMVTGNNFSISINAVSQAEADRLYNRLSEGGKAIMPMNKTFWGSYFGMLTDKFGIQWMVSFAQTQNK